MVDKIGTIATSKTDPSSARVNDALRAYARRRLDAIAADAAQAAGASPSPQPARAKFAGKDRRSEVERTRDALKAKSRTSWARSHPDIASAERAMRKNRAGLVGRWKHKNEGTPETHEHASRRKQGALARLYMSGAIDAEQLADAAEIAGVAARIAGDVRMATASYETRVDDGDRSETRMFETIGQVRREIAYTWWRDSIRAHDGLRGIAAVLEMIVGEGGADGAVGFTVVAKRYGMHNRRAKRLLIEALNLWPRILYLVRREVDEETLAEAHAALEGESA